MKLLPIARVNNFHIKDVEYQKCRANEVCRQSKSVYEILATLGKLYQGGGR